MTSTTNTSKLPVTARDTIAALAEQINALLLADAPEGAHHVLGVQWFVVDGKVVNFWATVRKGRTGLGNLVQYRPEYGWNEQMVRLAD